MVHERQVSVSAGPEDTVPDNEGVRQTKLASEQQPQPPTVVGECDTGQINIYISNIIEIT